MINPLFAPRADPAVTPALTSLDYYAAPQMPLTTGLAAFDPYSPQPEPMAAFASEPSYQEPMIGPLFALGPPSQTAASTSAPVATAASGSSSPQATAASTVAQQPYTGPTDVVRTYMPPPSGSFDPYTAAMTGNIPSFFSYRSPTGTGTGTGGTGTGTGTTIPADGGGGYGGTGAAGGGSGDGPSGAQGDQPSESTPSPDQSISGMLGALNTGLAVATGPLGIGTALGSLALSDYLGREPSINLGVRGTVNALGQALGLASPPAPPDYDIDTDDTVSDLPTADVDVGRDFVNDMYTEEALAAGAAAVNPATLAENIAMEEGRQSPAFGFGSYGFGTNPGAGIGSGDFSQINQDARDAAAEAADKTGANALAEATEVGAPPGGVFGDPDNPGGAPGGPDGSAGAHGGESDGQGEGWAQGGPVYLAGGGLVPLANGGKIAIGPGGGLDDLIPTSINGRRAAALSDGEFVIPADVVSMMGDGSSNAGARRFYDLVKQVRQTKTGTSRQAGPLPVGDILKRSLAR